MTRKYYTLCERTPNQLWSPEFGDYTRKVVEQEQRDRKDSGDFIKGTKFTIITTDEKQASIMEAVDALNDALTAPMSAVA